jgi:glycosyltransferase involved in cell wall biosynthesis
VQFVAPFARGLSHGGSQRSTGIAERLEARGAVVGWTTVARRRPTRGEKLRALARGRPTLAAEYAPAVLAAGGWDAVVVAHSYLRPRVSAPVPVVTDFHNLEWQHLRDVGASAAGPRRAWLAAQVATMRRCERRTVGHAPLCLFTDAAERAWAEGVAPAAGDRLLVVPNRLPRGEAAAAARIAARRRAQPPSSDLAYVGTLRFPPNVEALARFLREVWPVVRAQHPDAELHAAGGLGAPPPADRLRAPGVRHLGYVEDLEDLLARVAAVVFPFGGAAGSSLRALFFAAAAVPVVGDAEAFRGHGAPLGVGVRTLEEWTAAIAAAREAPVAAGAEAAVRELQGDERPWDELHERLIGLSAGASARVRPSA